MAPLWKMFNVNGQREPYLDNPRLFILNHKKGKTKMRKARRRTRRTARRSNAYLPAVVNKPRRRRRARRTAAFAANPRRSHRRHTTAKRRRGYRRNPPDILGFNLKDIAIAGAAVVVAPLVERQLMNLLPASMAGTMAGRWGVKVGSAVAVGFGAKKLLGPKAGNLAIIALGANLIGDAVSEFAPNLIPGTGVSAYINGGLGAYSRRGLSGGPMSGPRTYVGLNPALLTPAGFQTDPFKPAW